MDFTYTVAAGIANHLRGKLEWSKMKDIVAQHKTALDNLIATFMPHSGQFRFTHLRELDSTPRKLVFGTRYNILNVSREVTDYADLRITVQPTFGGWLEVEVEGNLAIGGRDRDRAQREFTARLMDVVELNSATMNYRRV